ncbi:MAG: hypothetical protein K0Q55_4039, partial [Verrucomicrobia bacterium]|nr:hypothetical protein [Verrucomicrobiota bacterium]
ARRQDHRTDKKRDGQKTTQKRRFRLVPMDHDKDEAHEGNEDIAQPPQDGGPKSQNQQLNAEDQRYDETDDSTSKSKDSHDSFWLEGFIAVTTSKSRGSAWGESSDEIHLIAPLQILLLMNFSVPVLLVENGQAANRNCKATVNQTVGNEKENVAKLRGNHGRRAQGALFTHSNRATTGW